MKVCWIDTETTGLDEKKHGIWQAAFIIEIDGVVVCTKEFFLNPEKEIDTEAAELSKITQEQLSEYPNYVHVKKDIRQLFKKYVNPYNKDDKFTPAGYNVEFDLKFLHRLWLDTEDQYFYSFFTHFPLDVMRLVTFAEWVDVTSKPESMSLSGVVEELRLGWNAGEEAHNAKIDITMTRDVAYRLKRLILGKRRRRILKG